MATELYVLAFITAYKNQPHLWDPELTSQVRSKTRHLYLQKVANEFQKNTNVSLSLDQVRAIISHLRYKYRTAFKYCKISGEQSSNGPFVWYFKKLTFLPSPLENDSITKLGQYELTRTQIIKILKTYEAFPHLWDTSLIENYCQNKRLEALEGMQNAIETKLGLKTNASDLKSYINCIHLHCSNEKRLERIKKTGCRSQYFKYMLYLYDHVGPFLCSVCHQKFASALKLKVHQSQHDGSVPLTCSICQKEYANIEPYIAHIRRHMDDLNVECKECGKRFLRLAELTIHMRAHTGAKPYCCQYCGMCFRHGTAFIVHKRRHEKKYLHKCPVCSKGFYEKDHMNMHLDTHKQERNHICKICGKAFKTKTTLRSHILIHEEGRNHECKVCGKMFKNRIGVSQHMRTHRKKEAEVDLKM